MFCARQLRRRNANTFGRRQTTSPSLTANRNIGGEDHTAAGPITLQLLSYTTTAATILHAGHKNTHRRQTSLRKLHFQSWMALVRAHAPFLRCNTRPNPNTGWKDGTSVLHVISSGREYLVKLVQLWKRSNQNSLHLSDYLLTLSYCEAVCHQLLTVDTGSSWH